MDTSTIITSDKLNKRCTKAKCFSAGGIFGQDNAYLDPEVRDLVVATNNARREEEAAE